MEKDCEKIDSAMYKFNIELENNIATHLIREFGAIQYYDTVGLHRITEKDFKKAKLSTLLHIKNVINILLDTPSTNWMNVYKIVESFKFDEK